MQYAYSKKKKTNKNIIFNSIRSQNIKTDFCELYYSLNNSISFRITFFLVYARNTQIHEILLFMCINERETRVKIEANWKSNSALYRLKVFITNVVSAEIDDTSSKIVARYHNEQIFRR